MKILVVEDDNKKASNVTALLSSIAGISKEDITPCADLVTAKRELRHSDFDLMVVDIQLPGRYDEEVRPLGGIEFLEEIKTRDKYRLPAHVIGLTAFEDSVASAERFFQENGWALVKYSESDIQWEVALRNCASYIFEHHNRQVDQRAETDYDYDLAIICALPQVEFESIAALPFNFVWSPAGPGMQFLDGSFSKGGKTFKIAAMFSPQMGMTPCAVLTLNMIHLLRPRYLAMSGIAAGVSGKVNAGDVLVADQSWDYGSGKFTVENGQQIFWPDPRPIAIDPDLKAKFQQLTLDQALADGIMNSWPGNKPETRLRVHVGPVPSGAAVIADPAVVEGIVAKNRKVIGLEMENYGFFHASAHASHPRPVAFSVKSVCDFADQDKGDAFQRYAAYTSAQIVYHFADRYLFN